MFWKKEKGIIGKAEEANKVLNALGIEAHTQSGKQIRSALAMELLGEKYDLMDKHSKASFIKDHGEVLTDVKQLLIEEGVLSRPPKKKGD